MVKVSSRYDPKFAEYLKSVGGKWDPNARAWEVPDDRVEEVEAKAKELKVQGFRVEAAGQAATGQAEKAPAKEAPAEGAIRMKLSKDGRFVLISVDLLAFTEDVRQMLDGKRRSVRFRVLPPRRPT
jgi:hypothetical protein